MRFILLFTFVMLIICPEVKEVRCQERSTGFSIEGFVKDVPDSTIFYLISDNNGIVDSIKTKAYDGKFIFKTTELNIGQLYFVKMDTSTIKLEPGKNSYVTILLDNLSVQLKGSLDQWPKVAIKGSDATEEYIQFFKIEKQPKKELEEILKLNRGDSIAEDKARTNYRRFIVEYLNSHTNSYSAPLLALKAEKVIGLENMRRIYDKLSKRAQNGYYGVKLNEKLRFLKEKEDFMSSVEMKGKGIKIGEVAPEIQGYTPEGTPLTLAQVVSKSKITLIDFWASWCGPCREALPAVKYVYNKYHDKGFNVISISIDKDEKAWKNAVKEEQLTWYNLSDMDAEKNSLSKELYQIEYIPRTFLLDSNGRIISVSLNNEKLLLEVSKALD